MTEIIEQGVREGVFDVAGPAVTAELSLVLWYAYADRIGKRLMDAEGRPQDRQELEAGLEALENAQERILGLPDGTLGIGIVGYVAAMTYPNGGDAAAVTTDDDAGSVAGDGQDDGKRGVS